MEELAKKIIYDHKNPIVKIDSPGSKLFLRAGTEEEVELVKNHQSNLAKILQHDRVEKRCGRVQAVWLLEKQQAKVLRVVKTLLKSFGHQDKTGIFLYPEETLYLMETNRLELQYNEVPLSLQEAYELVMSSPKCDLNKYRVFKKLTLSGYKLLRPEEMERRTLKAQLKEKYTEVDTSEVTSNVKKRKLDDSQEIQSKKTNIYDKLEESNSSSAGNRDKEMKYIADILESLRQCGPRESNLLPLSTIPDYYMFLPSNNHKTKHDFNIFICDTTIMDKKEFGEDNVPNIYAMCLEDSISFYRFSNVHLPCL